MLRGSESPMDFSYSSRDDKHKISGWGQGVKVKSVYSQDTVKIGSNMPTMTSPSRMKNSAGDLLASNKMNTERKNDIFAFQALIIKEQDKENRIIPLKTKTPTKEIETKIMKNEKNEKVISNKKRKRTDDTTRTTKLNTNHQHVSSALSQ